MRNPTLQNLLAAAIAGQSKQHIFPDKGIGIYRRNRAAGAARALSISYPTTTLMLGNTLLSLFARQFLADTGKFAADWGAWGSEFPAWLQRHPISNEHPYLADTARVDWAVHVSNRARDPRPDASSLMLLAKRNLQDIRVVFSPGTGIIRSEFPIVDIVNRHRENPIAPDLYAVRRKLAQGIGQTAIVWRQQFLARIREPLEGEAPWLNLIDDNKGLASAQRKAQPDDMSLNEWLTKGLDSQLIETLTTNPTEV